MHKSMDPKSQGEIYDDHFMGMTRRSVLAGAAATTAVTIGVDTPASAQDAKADMDTFVTLSAALTGIAKVRLAPDTDPIGIKQEYFKRASGPQYAATFAALLQIAREAHLQIPGAQTDGVIAQDKVDQLVTRIEAREDTKFLARSIVLMWYLGSWYEPDDLKKLTVNPQALVPHTVISSKAYTQGWVWPVAQAHPMGYSDMQFGYWTRPPSARADFIAVKPKGS
jgi:hypothetical protein